VLVAGIVAGLALLAVDRVRGRVLAAVVVVAVASGLSGSTAWALATAARPHTGAIPLPGPKGVVRSGLGGLPAFADFPGSPLAGLIDSIDPTAEVVAHLRDDSIGYRWMAAAIGGQQAAGYELATGRPVLDLGSHNGTDPWPTLDDFMKLVDTGQIRYFIGQSPRSRGPVGGRDVESTQIFIWVAETFRSTLVGDTTIYDLTDPAPIG
jgi:4-amino-4-deoxy-L-arabinose transferase-like glycosyltransferase